MNARAAMRYATNDVETGVHSSNSQQLIVLLYERLFDHLKIGKKELENGRYGIESFTKATELIQQGLLACLDYKGGAEVAQNLGAIYEWSLREIINARVTKSPEKIQEVLDVLTPLYEAWISLAPKEPIPVLQAVSSGNPVRVAAGY
ncbi:MAG: flagellar export chaperone FliS [Burkholderiaceae bacterium]|jgi:flagellar protein FliS|nr:flagellar export chaperone FliS [Burkholderiaceae bacterium]